MNHQLLKAAATAAASIMETEDTYNYTEEAIQLAFERGAAWQADQQPAPTVSSKMLEGEWAFCQTICDSEDVDQAMRNTIEDGTNDNAVCLVRAVLRAAIAARPETAKEQS